MSDSESSEEFEVKVGLEHEAKVKELIEKAKQILPSYTEESLFNIYKESFMTENVFLNKIDIISRQQRLLQDEGEEEWHYSKRGERQQPYQPKHITEKQRPLRQHYNFLEDIKLIERAQKFKRNEHRELPRAKPQQYKEKVEDKKEELPSKDKQEQKKEKPNQSFKQKKILYKQKEETSAQQPPKTTQKAEKVEKPVKVQKQEKTQIVQTTGKDQKIEKFEKSQKVETKTSKGDTGRKQKYTEKKEQPSPQAKELPKKEESKVSQVVTQQKNTVQIKPVSQVHTTSSEKPSQIKPAPKVQILPEEKKVSAPVIRTVVASESSVKVESTKRIDSQKEIKPLDPEVQKEFQNSINQNSFVLKFIKPSSKLQKVSYIRYADGTYKDVKVREPLQQKS